MNSILLNVSKLDGYLAGVISLSGNIREYSANAFLLESDNNVENLKKTLANFFPPEAGVIQFDFEELNSGLRELEKDIQDYLIIKPFGEGLSPNKEKVDDRKKYIAFRIMDIVDLVIGRCLKPMVYKVKATFKKYDSISIFFCISFGNQALVLQFLDNK